MAEEAKTNYTLITLSLGLLTGFVAYVSHDSSLTSSRPGSQGSARNSLIGDQTQPARLWQDPFSIELSSESANDTSEMRRQIGFWRRNTNEVSFLGVFVEGGTYAEDIEVRLRMRYAVQTALMDCSFIPVDRTHLGLMWLPWPRGTYLDPSIEQIAKVDELRKEEATYLQCQHLAVPFEWFTRIGTDGTNKAILVMWLREEEFADYPSKRLLIIDEALTRDTPQSLPPFKVLGPRSSNTLKLLADGTGPKGFLIDRSDTSALLPSFEFWSPEATTPDNLLYEESQAGREPRGLTKTKLRQNLCGANFHNLIALDDQVASKLVEELKCRGLETNSVIAIVSEADTLYGRSLPICFRRAFCPEINTINSICSASASLSNWPPNLFKFNYLRGLDGTTPRDNHTVQGESIAEQEGPATVLRTSKSNEPNLAEGDSQLDYANRLAVMIRNRVDSYPNHAKLQAVGVLGSDIYDKLILLQALRPVFPDALFFTTDLDARYLNPKLYPYTRNLIIASAYGLQNDQTNHGISTTTFRDVYQTALYVGCKHLLSGLAAPEIPAPRIYEIGRTQAVEFPATWPSERKEDFARVALASLVIALFLILRARLDRLRKWVPSVDDLFSKANSIRFENEKPQNEELVQIGKCTYFWQAVVWGTCGLAFVMIFLVACWISSQADGEPFYFAEGVSIWPTELVRLIALFLSLSSLVYAWHRHKRYRVLAWRQYIRKDSDSKFDEYLRDEVIKLYRSSPKEEFSHSFLCYLRGGLLRNRLKRSALATIVYVASLSLLIFHFSHPFVPFRGTYSKLIDLGILWSSIVTYCFLAFYVLDAVRLTARFISELGEAKDGWPSHALAEVAQERNMDPDHLHSYLDVIFTARQTNEVYSLIFYPFIVLFVMMLARNQFFDHWTWPPALLLVFIVNASILFISAFSIRRLARAVREKALKTLGNLQFRYTGQAHRWGSNGSEEYGEKLRLLSKEIKSVRMGAYANLFQDATLVAVMIPSGGLGLVALLQKLFLAA